MILKLQQHSPGRPPDFATQSFSVEHIIPVSLNGKTELGNLALACPGCNAHKYKKIRSPDPADGKVVPLYNPRTQQWQEHFRWNHDFSRIVRLTAVGRATVQALKLNRPGLIKIRNALFIIGWHPPTD